MLNYDCPDNHELVLIQQTAESDHETKGKPELKSRIHFREKRPNEQGILVESDALEEQKSTFVHKDRSEVALIWLRVFEGEGKYIYSEVNIHGTELLSLLQIQLAHYPDMHFPDPTCGLAGTINLTSPFEPLLHNWDNLCSIADWNDETDPVRSLQAKLSCTEITDASTPYGHLATKENLLRARSDLRLLLDQVRSSSDTKEYFTERETGDKPTLVSFKWLWTLFRPGELVYSTVFRDQPQLFIVRESKSLPYIGADKESPARPQDYWMLTCWSYDWDGEVFKRVPVVFYFPRFQGTKPIKTLPAHPLEFHEYGKGISCRQELEDMLMERGKRFRELCAAKSFPHQLEFDGEACVHCHGFRSSLEDARRRLDEELEMYELQSGDTTNLSSSIPKKKANIFQKVIRSRMELRRLQY